MHHTHSSQFFEGSVYVSNSQPVKARCRAQNWTVEYQIELGSFFFSVSCRDPRDSHWFEPFTIDTCLRLLKMSPPDEKLSGHKDVQIPGT